MTTKRILAVMSEYGYWGIELVGPLRKLEAAGYTFDFVTPKGKRAPCLPPSRDTTYIDPPLGVCVTTPSDKALVDAFEASNALDKTLNLSKMFPNVPMSRTPISCARWKPITRPARQRRPTRWRNMTPSFWSAGPARSSTW